MKIMSINAMLLFNIFILYIQKPVKWLNHVNCVFYLLIYVKKLLCSVSIK